MDNPLKQENIKDYVFMDCLLFKFNKLGLKYDDF